MLSRDVSVHPPSLPKPIRVPYAFQNGHFNLIEPLQFEGQSLASVFNKASIHAVEGEFLSEYNDPDKGSLRLIVVANFGPGQEKERSTASAVFEKHRIPMHTFASLDPLIEEIRQNAHA